MRSGRLLRYFPHIGWQWQCQWHGVSQVCLTLEKEIRFLNDSVLNNSSHSKDKNVKIFGSLLIPSKEFISRFKFRPWKGVFISEKYLNSLDDFYAFTKDLIEMYLDNNICPIIETECSSIKKLHDIHSLMKKITTNTIKNKINLIGSKVLSSTYKEINLFLKNDF